MADHAAAAAAAAPSADDHPMASQASSHFPLEPISADVLLRRETKRRDALRERGGVKTGCRGVDEYVLMGGLERGSVVGISAENEQLGLLISMQAVANEVCGGGDARAMVVTVQPPAAVLPTLRDAVKAELAALGVPAADVRDRLRSCLERVSVSRVFDFDGLWEVLGDLDIPPVSPSADGPLVPEDDGGVSASPGRVVVEAEQEVLVLPDLKPEPRHHPQTTKTEIADSDEEDAFSPLASPSSELSELSPPPSSMASMLATPEPHGDQEVSDHGELGEERQVLNAEEEEISKSEEKPVEEPATAIQSPAKRDDAKPSPPDIILITHFSALMTALFTRLDRASAHDSLQSLSDYLRYLSRSLSTSPLIILLNSTSSSKSKTLTRPDPAMEQGEAPPPPPPGPADGSPAKGGSSSVRPIDPSLCSIFNPPPLDIHGYNNQTLSRRNKPTFGLVFSQFLDLHLLCTRVPRTKEDGEMVYAAGPEGGDAGARFTWVVEVLLDEMGVWGEDEGRGGRRRRRCREQRWTPVEVAGGRVVDAFVGAAEKKRNVGDVRTVGGFGGPRV